MATRQYPALHELLQERNWKEDLMPDNLHMKVSLPGNETRDSMPQYEGKHGDIIRDIISHPQISTTSYLDADHKTDGMQVCPATMKDQPSKCKEVKDPITGEIGCSQCHTKKDIAYQHHGDTLATKRLQLQGQQKTMADFLWQNDPKYKEKVLGRRLT